MNTISAQYCPNFNAKVNIENVKGSKRNWEEIIKVVESKTENFKDGIIKVKTDENGLLDDLCFDNRYVAYFGKKVAKQLDKYSDAEFADQIAKTYMDWIWKINNIFG